MRSTLLCSGIAELRARGLHDAYLAKLTPESRAVITTIIAGVWLPADVAMEHFRAIDSLGLTADEAFAIGAGAGRRIHQSVHATLVRLATGVGANPWTVFDYYERLWIRIFDGGNVTIERLGPKEAIVEYANFPPARFSYFRHAFRGTHDVGLRLFTRMLYIRELPNRASDDWMALRFSWA